MLLRSFPRSLVLASLLPAAGCGTSLRTTPDDKQPVQQTRTDVAFADKYQLDDLACQSGDGTSAIGSQQLTFFSQGASHQVAFPFQGTASGTSLTGPGIDGTYYDFYQSTDCGAVGDDAS